MLIVFASLQETQDDSPPQGIIPEKSSTLDPRAFSDKISYAFQLATLQGPLCHEPMRGVAVFLEGVTMTPSLDEEATSRDSLGRLTGEVIKTVRDSIRQGFLEWSPRLLLAMYSCEIQASGEFPFPCVEQVEMLLLCFLSVLVHKWSSY